VRSCVIYSSSGWENDEIRMIPQSRDRERTRGGFGHEIVMQTKTKKKTYE